MKKKDSNNLAIIGASGTGKTTLAVGLYATAKKRKDDNLSVSPVGDETRKYIEIRQSAIEDGHWPAATIESENLDLRLRLHAGGKESDIVFREYMGERMEKDPNYIRDVIGTPKAAMILFNPGMPGLRSAESRNRMIGNLKVIAQHLKDNGCAAVAFVVTASDRLSSDLADFRADFENYASMVTIHLDALKLKWKRFDVTITGQLGDQNHPRLALGEDNTSLDPFLWLLDRIHERILKERLVRIAEWAAGIAAVLLAAFGVLAARSSANLSDIEKETARLETDLSNAWKTRDRAVCSKGLDGLRTLATNSLPVAQKVGSSNRKRADALASRLADDVDLWSVRSLLLEYDDIDRRLKTDPLVLLPGWAKSFDDRLAVAKPSEPIALSELVQLKGRWKDNRPVLEKRWQIAKLGKEVEQKSVQLEKAAPDRIPAQLKEGFDFLKTIPRDYPLVDEREALAARLDVARTNALARYCASITTWSVEDETPPAAGAELRQKLKTDLSGKISPDEFRAVESALLSQQKNARIDWDAYQFPKKVREHETALKSAGANPVPALRASLSFLGSMTNNFPTIQRGQILEKQHAIQRARKEAIKTYSDSLADEWDVNGRNPPEFDGQKIRDTVLTDAVVTTDEAFEFALDMQRRFNAAKQQWNEHQKKLVEQFNANGDIQTAVRSYGEFIDENSRNPWLEILHDRMENRLVEYFKDYINDYYGEFFGENRVGNETYAQSRMERAQRRFNEFRAVCLAIAGDGWAGSPLQKSGLGKFAKLCVDRGNLQSAGITAAFEQTIRVTKVDVMFQPSSLDSSYTGMSFSCNLVADRWNFSSGQQERIVNSSLFSGVTLAKSSNGRWVTLWSGSHPMRTNPWTFNSFRLFYSERLDATMIVEQNSSSGFWLDFETGSQTGNYSATIHFVHDALWNDNVSGTLSIRFSFVGEGNDFLSLWKTATE